MTVRMAVPEGRTIPRRVSEWIEEALAHPCTAAMTAQSFRTYRAFVMAIANAIDPATRTTQFSWASLGEAVARLDPRAANSRASVARYLRLLHQSELLGTVATGRTARYAPRSAEQINERAVYVLVVARRLRAVDSIETPPLGEADVAPRTRTREDQAQAQTQAKAEPLRGQPHEAAQARPVLLTAQRQPPPWPTTVTPQRKDDTLAAAATLCRLSFPLARISARHIRSIARRFFLAGWTVGDVLHAIDHRPDGTRWPHDGADGVENIGAWLTHRLAAWVDGRGTVRRSRAQQIRSEQLELVAHARARREAEVLARRGKARGLTPGRVAARAVADAIRTGRRLPDDTDG